MSTRSFGQAGDTTNEQPNRRSSRRVRPSVSTTSHPPVSRPRPASPRPPSRDRRARSTSESLRGQAGADAVQVAEWGAPQLADYRVDHRERRAPAGRPPVEGEAAGAGERQPLAVPAGVEVP